MSDAHIRKQAIDPTKSFIVSAPAGSGKTSLLVQRYINLLCTVSKPEQVVAITFTRKAAAEMQNRVLEVIALADSTQPLSGHMLDNQILAKKLQQHAKKNHWNLINHNFRILTIDALNNRLLQHSPLGSGLGAEQDLNINAAPDYKLAIQSFLYANKNTVSQAAFSDLLQHCNNDIHAIEKLLSYMLQSREQWLPYIFYTQPEKMRHSLETALYNFNMLALSKLQECFDNKITTELLPLLRFASVHSSCKILDDNLMLADFCVDNVELFKNIGNIFLTKDDAWRKTVNTRQGFPTASADFTKAQCKHNKQQCMAFIDSQRDNKPLLQALVATRNLPPAKYSNEQWQVLSALIILLPELIAHLKVVFQKTGRSDYTERSLSAIYALNQNMQGIRAQSDADIEHILIDEFQDTSMAQYRLLYALTQDWDKNCNKTLFCVGDPMQSIYRFRQADVNLFINATQHGIANIQLQHLVLTQNFRSEPLLIDWVNQHMQHAFTQHGGAIKFNAAISSKPNSKQSYVNFEACTSADDEAQAILETINSIKTQDPDGKIAIIARNRRHLAHIVPLLQKNNISINAQELTPIAKQDNIRHLHCLTAILLHPGDEIAWAGLLRSPLVACTLQDLYSIKQQQSLPMLLDKIPEQIDQTTRARLLAVVNILNNALLELTINPLPQVLHITWNKLTAQHGWGRLTAAMHDYIAQLSNWLASSHEQDIAEFSALMQSSYTNNLSADKTAVEIMTIHHAKGLEFEHVIIPGMANFNAPSKNKLLYWREINYENRPQLLLAPLSMTIENNEIYASLRSQETAEEYAEITRVLYVAVTRAKRSLNLFAKLEVKDNAWTRPRGNSMLAGIWDLLRPPPPEPAEQSATTASDNIIFPFTLQRWQYALSADKYAAHKALANNDRYAATLGTMVHEILEFFTLDDAASWLQPNAAVRERLLSLCIKHGIAKAAQTDATQHILRCMRNIATDTRAAWIFATTHDAIASELRICKPTSDSIASYIIDRSFIDNGTRWIIDFKTSTPADGASAAQFLAQQRELYSAQLANYATLFEDEGRPIMLGLYFPANDNAAYRWLQWQAYNPKDAAWQAANASKTHSVIDS